MFFLGMLSCSTVQKVTLADKAQIVPSSKDVPKEVNETPWQEELKSVVDTVKPVVQPRVTPQKSGLQPDTIVWTDVTASFPPIRDKKLPAKVSFSGTETTVSKSTSPSTLDTSHMNNKTTEPPVDIPICVTPTYNDPESVHVELHVSSFLNKARPKHKLKIIALHDSGCSKSIMSTACFDKLLELGHIELKQTETPVVI